MDNVALIRLALEKIDEIMKLFSIIKAKQLNDQFVRGPLREPKLTVNTYEVQSQSALGYKIHGKK